MDDAPPAMISTPDLAAETGISVSTWTRWRNTGKGPPFYRVHSCIRYDHAEVTAWLAARRTEHATPAAPHAPLVPGATGTPTPPMRPRRMRR